MTKREQNRVDKQIDEIARRRCSGMAINVMDIGKVFDAGRRAYTVGDDVETAVVEAYTRYATDAS